MSDFHSFKTAGWRAWLGWSVYNLGQCLICLCQQVVKGPGDVCRKREDGDEGGRVAYCMLIPLWPGPG